METWGVGCGEWGVGEKAQNTSASWGSPTPHSPPPTPLPDLDPIPDPHRIAHRHDLAGGGVRIRRQDADFAEHLVALARSAVFAVDGEEIAGLDLVGLAEVDLHEQTLAEGCVPSALGADDIALALPAGGLAELGHVGHSTQRNGNLRQWLEARADVNVQARLRDDPAGVVIVRAEHAQLAGVQVLSSDDLRAFIRMRNEAAVLHDDVRIAGHESRGRAAVEDHQVARRAADVLRDVTRLITH